MCARNRARSHLCGEIKHESFNRWQLRNSVFVCVPASQIKLQATCWSQNRSKLLTLPYDTPNCITNKLHVPCLIGVSFDRWPQSPEQSGVLEDRWLIRAGERKAWRQRDFALITVAWLVPKRATTSDQTTFVLHLLSKTYYVYVYTLWTYTLWTQSRVERPHRITQMASDKSAHTALAVKACLLGCKQLH